MRAAIAAAHGDHAQLALEFHEAFEDQADGRGLRAQHGRKSGFWAQVSEASGARR